MFNRIMPTQLLEIKPIRPITASQKIARELGHEEAEARREVERFPYGPVQLAERDVLAVVRQDGVVRERVEHGTGAAGVAGAWGVVGGPVAVEAGGVGGNDGIGGMGWEHEVEEEEAKVPGEDEDVEEGFCEFGLEGGHG